MNFPHPKPLTSPCRGYAMGWKIPSRGTMFRSSDVSTRLYSAQLLSVDRPTAPASTPSCLATPLFVISKRSKPHTIQSSKPFGNCYYLITLSSLQSLNDAIVSATPFDRYSSIESPTSHSEGTRPHVTAPSLQRTGPNLYKFYTISHFAQNISFRIFSCRR